MTARIFNDLIRNQLTCKPGYEDTISVVNLYETNPAQLGSSLLVFPGARGQAAMMKAIEAEIKSVRSIGIMDAEFVMQVVYGNGLDQRQEVYLVNSEGYDYARYIGKLSSADAAAYVRPAKACDL